MEYNIDFSQIDLLELRKFNISFGEINSVITNPSSYFENKADFIFVLGFSDKRKFVQMAYRISKNTNFEIEALQIGLPYEKDIKENWCAG